MRPDIRRYFQSRLALTRRASVSWMSSSWRVRGSWSTPRPSALITPKPVGRSGQGVIDADSLQELGKLLASPVAFADDEIVVADLTGIGIPDVQIAKAIRARISAAQGFTRPISS
jgi:hypothetical protein